MPKLCGKAYEPIRILFDQVLVEGGYARTAEPVPIRKATCSGTTQLTFLRVQAREPWLIAAACGTKQIEEGLTNRTTLVNDLREMMAQACDGLPTHNGLIRCRGDAEAAAADAPDDPMNAVSDDEVTNEAALQQRVRVRDAKRARYFTNHCKDKILELTMPERAPESGVNGGNRIVRIFCEDRKTVWLCSEDADWAVTYLRDQLMHKGGAPVPSDDLGPKFLPLGDGSLDVPKEG